MTPFEIQCGLYAQIKRTLDGTKIYRDLGLESINTYADYVQQVLVGDYEFYGRYVAQLETAPDILFKDELKYYGMTTGTNCAKKIPYNLAMLGCFLRFQKEIGATALHQTDGVNPSESIQFTYGSQYVSKDAGKIP